MLLGKDSEVLVHNFAPECFFSVEVAYYVLRILCYIEEFLNSYYKLIVKILVEFSAIDCPMLMLVAIIIILCKS